MDRSAARGASTCGRPSTRARKEQGNQSPLTPAQRYRKALAGLDKHCKDSFAGKTFAQLPDAQKDKLLTALEKGELQLDGTSGKAFFDLLLQNAKEGFFADPVYGGNREHGGLANDRLPRRALRLPGLDRPT